MNELLRKYSQQRRRQGVALHPVSRRALQDAVRQEFGEKRAPAKPSLLSSWWIRCPLATALAACAVLLVLKNRRFEEANAPMAPTVAAVPASRLAAPAAMPMGGAAPVFRNGASSPVAENRAQTFTQAGASLAASDKVAAAPAVLQSFQVRRAGNRVTITDADGSIYDGTVREDKSEAAIHGAVSKAQTAPGYGFSVQGVNTRIQQPVQFSGRVISAAGAARVVGAATVGATNQMRIEAAAAP
jgi:hypothetical protein